MVSLFFKFVIIGVMIKELVSIRELLLMQIVSIIEDEYIYTDKELSINSKIGKDYMLDDLDLVEIMNKLEELLCIEFDLIEISEEVLDMSLAEFVSYLESKIIA